LLRSLWGGFGVSPSVGTILGLEEADVDMQELRDIIRLLHEEGLTEITVVDGDQRVTVKREPSGVHRVDPAGVSPISRPREKGPVLSESEFALTAPLVGTFYRRPAPDTDPFVAPGKVVDAGETVCIIEAMKVMNEIKAEARGRVVRILLEDGANVEFAQPLIVFERV
jgi:acetyl-CoA carboxylase biotin carboxyl carrier protein